MDTGNTSFHPLDEYTYNQLQKLKIFINFVASLPETEAEDKQNVDKVNGYLENITNPNMQPSEWMVAINIFDFEIQGNPKTRSGIYWKQWWLVFESGILELYCQDNYVFQDDSDDEILKYELYIGCTEELEVDGKFVHGDPDVDKFINDALNFRSYITDN